MTDTSKLSTESYKGVRDFYPEDAFALEHIFSVWRKVVESFGYVEYSASLLEPAELYKAKTGEEIVSNETYTFTDRGGREVTLRPEMTPSVARMVAGKVKELVFPLRWYSIPNLFRYEKPQRGRLREHWQLNVDLFGVEALDADVEVISMASEIMLAFGAKKTDFIIKINSRKIINAIFKHFELTEEQAYKVSKIIDKKAKISPDAFDAALEETLDEKAGDFGRLLEKNSHILETLGDDNPCITELTSTIEKLSASGIDNIEFDPTLMRGFDYYTGIVFEVFDTHPDNNRSVFGGGRYDDLLDIFGAKKIPAVGFGAGDVTTHDFLDVHGLLPKYVPTAEVYVCTLHPDQIDHARMLARALRESGINVALDLSGKKVSDQMKLAHKQMIPFSIVVGEDEVKSGTYPLKNMDSGEEKKLKLEEIPGEIKRNPHR